MDPGKLSCTAIVSDTTSEGFSGGVVPNNEPGCLNSPGHPCIHEEKANLYNGEEACGHYKLTTSVGGPGNTCDDYA